MSKQLAEDSFLSSKIISIFIIAFLSLFILGILAITFLESEEEKPSFSSYSYAVSGHHAFASTLDAMNIHYLRGRRNFYDRIKNRLILFLHSNPYEWYKYTHESMYDSLEKINEQNIVLITLPKYEIIAPHEKNKKWVGQWQYIYKRNLQDFCKNNINYHYFPQGIIKRENIAKFVVRNTWNGKQYNLQTNTLQYFSPNFSYGKVLIETLDKKVIAIFYESLKYIVVSDPEIFMNLNIAKEQNGELAIELIEHIKQENKTINEIIIDEISHGLGRPPSILRALLTPPGLYITLQILFIGAFIVWLISIRFRPVHSFPARQRSLEEQCKAFANITCYGNRDDYFAQKYFRAILQECTEQIPSLADKTVPKKIEYLEQLGKMSKNPYSIKNLYKQLSGFKHSYQIPIIIKGLHQWKARMKSLKR